MFPHLLWFLLWWFSLGHPCLSTSYSVPSDRIGLSCGEPCTDLDLGLWLAPSESSVYKTQTPVTTLTLSLPETMIIAAGTTGFRVLRTCAV